jgi:hypothetical protein
MYNRGFPPGREEYYYREEGYRPEIRAAPQKSYPYNGNYFERETFDYGRPVSHMEPNRYYENREYRTQPPSQPYPSERSAYPAPTERTAATRLSYHPPPPPEYAGEGYDRRTSMQTDKAAFGSGSVYAPSRASSRAVHYPEQRESISREPFSRRRQPSYESLRSVPSPYIPAQAPAPARQYNGSEYSEAQRAAPPTRSYAEQPRLSHRASFVEEPRYAEEKRSYEPQLHRKASAYLDADTRSRTNGEEYTPPTVFTSQRPVFKTRSYLNMQSDAVSTTSTKGRREPEEAVAQDKHPLPKSFRQTADKIETLIRNTSRLSTTDDPKGTQYSYR